MDLKIPVFDGHNDTLLSFYLPGKEKRPFFEKSDKGHIDLPRAREAGLAGGLFAIFVPHDFHPDAIDTDKVKFPSSGDKVFDAVDPAYASRVAKIAMDRLGELTREGGGKLVVARSVPEIRKALEEERLSAVIHFEGAEPIRENLENLGTFYKAGLRSVGLVWNRPNRFGRGVDFAFPGSPDTGPGLTHAGKALVRECNRMGIMVDLSHLNEKGFRDVERISDAPLVATHSCVHAICPISRNLTDRQLDAVGASGGVVGINFCPGFIRRDGKLDRNTPMDDLVRHFVHIADRIGIDHVAMGSDFDGTSVPAEIGDVRGLPRLLGGLRDHGFDDDALRKIAMDNWLRVLEQTWKS